MGNIWICLSLYPVRTINFADPSDKVRHDRMVELFTKMLELNNKVQDAKLEHEKTLLQRQTRRVPAAEPLAGPILLSSQPFMTR